MRYFFRPHKAPPIERMLLVESGSRHLIERVIPGLRQIYGEHVRFDLFTCFPGVPNTIDPASSRIYRTADYQSTVSRSQLYRELTANDYQVTGIICSAEPIMTKWKWMLAFQLPSRVFLLNENGDYVWFDRNHADLLFAYAQLRLGFEGAGAVRTVARIVLLPLTLLYLITYALLVHARRALRLIAS
jgi:hypothetical protein